MLTSGRLELVAEQGKIDVDPQPNEEATGWLGDARAAAAQVQKTAEGFGSRKDAKLPVAPGGDITAVASRRLILTSHFLEVRFADRSALLFRKRAPGNYVGESGFLARS